MSSYIYCTVVQEAPGKYEKLGEGSTEITVHKGYRVHCLSILEGHNKNLAIHQMGL